MKANEAEVPGWCMGVSSSTFIVCRAVLMVLPMFMRNWLQRYMYGSQTGSPPHAPNRHPGCCHPREVAITRNPEVVVAPDLVTSRVTPRQSQGPSRPPKESSTPEC